MGEGAGKVSAWPSTMHLQGCGHTAQVLLCVIRGRVLRWKDDPGGPRGSFSVKEVGRRSESA